MPRWRQKCHGLLTRTKPRKSEKQEFLEKVAAGRFTSVGGDGGLVTGLWPNWSSPHQTPVTHTWPPPATLISALGLCCCLSSKCPSLLSCPWLSLPSPTDCARLPHPLLLVRSWASCASHYLRLGHWSRLLTCQTSSSPTRL